MIEPVAGLRLQASYAYIDTKLTRFTQPDLSAQPPGGYDNVSSAPVVGKPLPYTPKHKLTLSALYRLPLADDIGRVSIGSTFVFTGKIYHGPDTVLNRRVYSIFDPSSPNYDTSIAPSYSLVNFTVSWEKIMNSALDAQLFVTNAFDKLYYDSRSLSGSQGYTSRSIGEPRMFGAKLRYNF